MYKNVNINDLTATSTSFELDGVKISAMQVPHVPGMLSYAYKFEAGGQSVVVSGDLKYSDDFITFAKGADVLVMDGIFAQVMTGLPQLST